MSDIYIPIGYSKIKSVIPEGHEILYSTLAGLTFIDYSEMSYSGKKEKTTIQAISHSLITNHGVAVDIPLAMINFPAKVDPSRRKSMYVPLYNVTMYKSKTSIGLHIPGKTREHIGINLLPINDKKIETKQAYNERMKQFRGKIYPLIEQETLEFINDAYKAFSEDKFCSYDKFVVLYDWITESKYNTYKKSWQKGKPAEKNLNLA